MLSARTIYFSRVRLVIWGRRVIGLPSKANNFRMREGQIQRFRFKN